MHFCCRAPYGARGLKFWAIIGGIARAGRAPYGARGLKFINVERLRKQIYRRAPYGARGLK